MIHVRDLASICFVLGNSYDVLEERFFFAIDSGTCSVQQLCYALNKSLRGEAIAVKFTSLAKYSAAYTHVQGKNSTTHTLHNDKTHDIITTTSPSALTQA